jgi:hypothetical protein
VSKTQHFLATTIGDRHKEKARASEKSTGYYRNKFGSSPASVTGYLTAVHSFRPFSFARSSLDELALSTEMPSEDV